MVAPDPRPSYTHPLRMSGVMATPDTRNSVRMSSMTPGTQSESPCWLHETQIPSQWMKSPMTGDYGQNRRGQRPHPRPAKVVPGHGQDGVDQEPEELPG